MNLSSISSLLSQSRRLVGHFQHNDNASEALRQRQTQEGFGQALNIISDNATRWNSVVFIIQRFHKLRFPISIVLSDPTVSKASDQALNLSATQWDQVKFLRDLIKPFGAATESFSSAKDVSVSTILPLVFGLRDESVQKETDSPFLTEVKAKLRQEIIDKLHLERVQTLVKPLLLAWIHV